MKIAISFRTAVLVAYFILMPLTGYLAYEEGVYDGMEQFCDKKIVQDSTGKYDCISESDYINMTRIGGPEVYNFDISKI